MEFKIAVQKPTKMKISGGEPVDMTMGVGGGGIAPNYPGPYEIIPRAHDVQVLSTKGKRMKEDVTVLQVPYWATENFAHGNTVYIANE